MRKTIIVIGLVLALMLSQVSAWQLDVLGYSIKYEPVEVIDHTTDTMTDDDATDSAGTDAAQAQNTQYTAGLVPLATNKYASEVQQVNNDKYAQSFLKELGYDRIGVVETDTGDTYTVIVDDAGTVKMVLVGLVDEDVVVKGSESRLRYLYERGDYVGIAKSVDMPWSARLRMLTVRWLPWE